MADWSQYFSGMGSSGGGSSSAAPVSSSATSGVTFGADSSPSWLVPAILGGVVLLMGFMFINSRH